MNQRRMTIGALILVALACLNAASQAPWNFVSPYIMAPILYLSACHTYLRAWRESFRMPRVEVWAFESEPPYFGDGNGLREVKPALTLTGLVSGAAYVIGGSPLQRARDDAHRRGLEMDGFGKHGEMPVCFCSSLEEHLLARDCEMRKVYDPGLFPHEIQDLRALRGRSLADTSNGDRAKMLADNFNAEFRKNMVEP